MTFGTQKYRGGDASRTSVHSSSITLRNFEILSNVHKVSCFQISQKGSNKALL